MASEARRLPELLVVDDEPQVLQAIGDQLEDRYVVHAVSNGKDALRLLGELHDVAVLLSDQRMPGMRGDDVLAQAARISDATQVLITGFADLDAVIRAVNGGRIFGYVTKPWDQESLRLMVHRAEEHHRLLRELRASEQRHRAMFEQAAVGIVHSSPNGRIMLANPTLCALSGYAPGELAALTIRDLTHPDDIAPSLDARAQMTSGRAADYEREFRLLRKDGTHVWVNVTTSLARAPDGTPTYFISIVNDVSARKRAERELLRLWKAMDLSPDSIYLTDPAAMRFVYVNQAACRRLGHARERLLAMGPQDVLSVPAEQIRREYEEVIAAGEKELRQERRFRRSDGSEGWTELHWRALRDEAGVLIVTIGRDVSERRQAEEQVRRLSRVHAMLSGINATIVRVRTREELFRETCRLAVETGGFRLVTIRMASGSMLVPVESFGPPDIQVSPIPTRPPAGGEAREITALRAFRERRVQVSNDLESDPLQTPLRRQAVAHGIRSVISLPLVVEEEAVGVLTLAAQEANSFDDDEIRVLEDLAGDVSFALSHIEKSERADYLAYYDELTGLANRRLFEDRLGNLLHAAGHAQRRLAVALIDIERLRKVNELRGRHVGDALLKGVARRLAQSAEAAELGRISADHFGVVLQDVDARADLARRLEKLWQGCFGAPLTIDGEALHLSAKAGVATFPGDGADAETLLGNAEAALRRAKSSGERHGYFDAALATRTADSLSLENRLRGALEKDEFVLHYQPKIELQGGRIAGLEALIRWRSPEEGLVAPEKFLRLLEETGLILDVGRWALERAALDHRRWVDARLPAPRIGVNVSPVQLRRSDFARAVEEALAAGVAPTAIDLEITESLVMEDVESSVRKLNELRRLGVQVAIDDFGTGYSSLSYLPRLPVQALKIDRSFIARMLEDPMAMTLVQTIISLAHSLGLLVIAEGVDHADQAKYLRLLRCDQMQGYLASPALPFEEMTALLRREAR